MVKILLIGDVVIDVTLKSETENLKLRLGGIVHAARGLWALIIPYAVGYFSPSYLDERISHFLEAHGCVDIFKLGDVTGSPYVFLVEEAKEIGDQGYEFLLRDEIKINYNSEAIEKLSKNSYEENILISGDYDQTKLINHLAGNIHIDAANNVEKLSFFSSFDRKINTIFVSTSSVRTWDETVAKKHIIGTKRSFLIFSLVTKLESLKILSKGFLLAPDRILL